MKYWAVGTKEEIDDKFLAKNEWWTDYDDSQEEGKKHRNWIKEKTNVGDKVALKKRNIKGKSLKIFAIGNIEKKFDDNSGFNVKWKKLKEPRITSSTFGQTSTIKEVKNKEAIEEIFNLDVESQTRKEKKSMQVKNIILYGSPGVGKTHNTNKLIKLIEDGNSDKDIFEAIKKNENSDSVDISDIKERVKFVTFHQSFGYEDFMEGFRPNEEGDIELVDGVFKSMCDKARENTISSNISTALSEEIKYISDKPKIWKLSLGTGGEIKKECFSENCIRLGWDNYGDLDSVDTIKQRELKDFYNLEIGDIIFAFKNQWEIDGIGIVIGNYTFEDSYSKYKHKRDVTWVIKDKVINIKDFNANTRMTLSTLYKLNRISKQNVLEILKDNQDEVVTDNSDPKNYYLVIDEINRGNISKIFGELITLIEEDKRDNLEVTLPYSKQPFKIPSNLYIIGTMNSTDKSIALIDIALRRRFTFLKMKPNETLIAFPRAKEIFIALNEQITKDLGEDYQIGHSYFMKIADENALEFALEYKIIPLLEEYYYGDDRLEESVKLCKLDKSEN